MEALLEELAIMKGIKPHSNVVNLLGCCTTPGIKFRFLRIVYFVYIVDGGMQVIVCKIPQIFD